MSTKTESEATLAERRLPIAKEAHATAKQVHQEASQKHEEALAEKARASTAYEETPSLENKRALDAAAAAVAAAESKLTGASRDVRDTAAMVAKLEGVIEQAEIEARRLVLEKRAEVAEFHARTAPHFKALLEAEKALRAACLAIDAEFQASLEAAKGAGVQPFSAEHLKLPLRLAYAGDNPRALRWLLDWLGPSSLAMPVDERTSLARIVLAGLDLFRPQEGGTGDVETMKTELEIVKSSRNEFEWRSRIRDERCRRATAGATDEDALYELSERRRTGKNAPDGSPLPPPEKKPIPPAYRLHPGSGR